jgi:hypothetical protein
LHSSFQGTQASHDTPVEKKNVVQASLRCRGKTVLPVHAPTAGSDRIGLDGSSDGAECNHSGTKQNFRMLEILLKKYHLNRTRNFFSKCPLQYFSEEH